MKKAKLFGIGLASILSVASVGCSNKQTTEKAEKATMTQKAEKQRQQNGREDISLSYINPTKDYVKSINCLLSLYRDVIPLVEKNVAKMDIGQAIHQAYVQCRLDGKLKENSIAYNFDDLISMNYSGDNLEQWKTSFEKAGTEASKILAEGDSVSRKYVPMTPTGKPFLRREIVNTNEISWKTAEEYETQHIISEQTKNFFGNQH